MHWALYMIFPTAVSVTNVNAPVDATTSPPVVRATELSYMRTATFVEKRNCDSEAKRLMADVDISSYNSVRWICLPLELVIQPEPEKKRK